MNKLKEKKESTVKKEVSKKRNPFTAYFIHILDGSFLSKDGSVKNIPFALFLSVIGGFYIANTYNAERTVRETSKTNKDLKELRSEYITLKSELMFHSNQSQVAQLVAPLGLKEAKVPPFKIYTSSENQQLK
jgi:hypothetical protein